MNKLKDLTGQRFGSLVVIKRADNLGKYTAWLCQCDCGNTSVVRSLSLVSNKTRHCLRCRPYGQKEFRKNLYQVSSDEDLEICYRLRRILGNMKYRCSNPTDTKYDRYGGRGIKVCDEWVNNSRAFVLWALENGYKPGLTIDRIDNDGDYEPGNCRFVTRSENSSRSSRANFVSVNGQTLNITQWSKVLGINRSRLQRVYCKKGKSGTEDFIREQLNMS